MTSLGRTNITACIRCRQKKKRCDLRLPRCHLCETAGVECVVYDALGRKEIPRSYVYELEQRVAFLEGKLRRCTCDGEAETTTSRPDMAAESPLNAVQASEASPQVVALTDHATLNAQSESTAFDNFVRWGTGSPQRTARSEPLFSSVFPATLLGSRVYLHPIRYSKQDTVDDTASANIVGSLDSSPVSLPPISAARKLVKAYFQCAGLGMPLLHEPTFEKKLDRLYNLPRTINLDDTHSSTECRIDVFFVLEVFAVGILCLQKQNPSGIPTWLADRYHTAAINALNAAGLPGDVDGVQVLLLMGLYAYHHPINWAAWKIIGVAVRLAVELGLHADSSSTEIDFLTLDTMRRTFWVAYSMDRSISVSLNTPPCLSDGAITAKFPSEVNDEFITADGAPPTDAPIAGSKSVSIALFKYRLIQSEMQRVLSEAPSPPYLPVNMEEWQQRMRERIEGWYNDRPQSEALSDCERGVVDTFEVTYHAAVFHLYRPSRNIPSPSGSQLMAMSHAASRMISLYRRFFCDRQLTIYWQAAENLSSAGTCLMFAYVKAHEVRQSLTFRSFEALVRTCSSVLWGMVERFPSFQGKRDEFDRVACKVLEELSTTAKTSPTETRLENLGVPFETYLNQADTMSLAPTRIFPAVAEAATQFQPPLGSRLEHEVQMSYHELTPPSTFETFDDMSFNWEDSLGQDATFSAISILQ